MAIVQEDRFAPQPEVVETEYGAQYVKAATETPVAEQSVNEEAPAAEAPEKPKKAGRPKKEKK